MEFKYLKGYSDNIHISVNKLIENEKLGFYLENKYKKINFLKKDKELYNLAKEIKDKYIKNQKLPERIIYDNKIELCNQALGLHSYIPSKQGKKIKIKNEIKISSRFKELPYEFMENVLIHELCHLKEKEHNKAFYSLCKNISENYFEIDLDIRIYLTYIDIYKSELWRS
jgi:hypothetical protein